MNKRRTEDINNLRSRKKIKLEVKSIVNNQELHKKSTSEETPGTPDVTVRDNTARSILEDSEHFPNPKEPQRARGVLAMSR